MGQLYFQGQLDRVNTMIFKILIHVDMFPTYTKSVDMFLLVFPNTDTLNVHLSYFLGRRRDCLFTNT